MTTLAIYQLMAEPGLSFLEFHAELEGWEAEVIYREEKPVAVIKRKGPELHFKSFGGYSITRADIKEILQPAWDKYGFAETTTPKSDIRQQRFNERFGFRKVDENDTEVRYRIDRPRVRATCQL